MRRCAVSDHCDRWLVSKTKRKQQLKPCSDIQRYTAAVCFCDDDVKCYTLCISVSHNTKLSGYL